MPIDSVTTCSPSSSLLCSVFLQGPPADGTWAVAGTEYRPGLCARGEEEDRRRGQLRREGLQGMSCVLGIAEEPASIWVDAT